MIRKNHSKLGAQGQVSVPALVRTVLNLRPDSVLVWTQEDDRIMVERAKLHSTAEVHRALFPEGAPGDAPAKTLAELKQGVRQRVQRRHPCR